MNNLNGKIDHVIVLMLENRSFDDLVGWLYDNESNRPARNIPERNPPAYFGLTTGSFGNPTSFTEPYKTIYATQGTPKRLCVPTPDPNELFKCMNRQLFGPCIDKSTPGWLPAKDAAATMNGFVVDYATAQGSSPQNAPTIMQTYCPLQVQVMSGIAKCYAISDDYHASSPTQTWPNRAFMHAGTSKGRVNNWPYWPYVAKTIFNVLEAAGADWRVYNPSLVVPSLTRIQMVDLWDPLLERHFHSIDRFIEDAKAGDLPAYTFLEPSFIIESAAEDATSEHPPGSVAMGEQYLQKIWDAVRKSPCWRRTLFIVNYDEHGGCPDHVPPHWTAAPPDSNSNPGDEGFCFDRFGVRVPAIVASPWIESGTVFRATADPWSPKTVPFDHTSILAMILDWQGLERSCLPSARVAAAPTFDNILTCSQPRDDAPAFQANPLTPTDQLSPDTELTSLSQSIVIADAHYRAAKKANFAPDVRASQEEVQRLCRTIKTHRQAYEHFKVLHH